MAYLRFIKRNNLPAVFFSCEAKDLCASLTALSKRHLFAWSCGGTLDLKSNKQNSNYIYTYIYIYIYIYIYKKWLILSGNFLIFFF